MSYDLGERVGLCRLQRLGLGDQVLIPRRIVRRDKIDRNRGRHAAVIGRRQFVNDSRDVGRSVLRRLARCNDLRGDKNFGGNSHGLTLLR